MKEIELKQQEILELLENYENSIRYDHYDPHEKMRKPSYSIEEYQREIMSRIG